MPSDDELEKRRAILRARGIPERFVHNLATRADNWVDDALGIALGFAICSVPAFVYILNKPLIDNAIASLVYLGLPKSELFGTQVSYWLLLGWLWWIVVMAALVLSGLVLRRPVKPYPAYSAAAANLRRLGEDESLDTLKPVPEYQALAHLSDDTEFLKGTSAHNSAKGWQYLLKYAALPLLVLALICHFDHWSLEGDTLILQRPWGKRIYSLKEALAVKVDCKGGPDDDQFRYLVTFPHRTFDLAVRGDGVNRLDEQAVFGRLEKIDAYLRHQNLLIQRETLSVKSSESDGACSSAWADELHPDGQVRFARLLYGAPGSPSIL